MINKEWLQQKIAEMEEHRDLFPGDLDDDHGKVLAALRIALASLEAEPVAYSLIFRNMDGVLNDYVNANTTFSTIEKAQAYGRGGNYVRQNDGPLKWVSDPSLDPVVVPLFTTPPAPVSVPDERYQHLSELYHAQEKRLFKLAQRIKGASFDKYAYSPSQAIDVLESAIFGEREDDCRAAMLQGAEPVSNHDELPLDYLQGHRDGLEWAAQLAEANHPQTGDWLYDDPIELAKAIRKGPDMPELKSVPADADDNFYSWFGRFWSENYQQNNYTTSAKQMLGTMAEFAFRAGRESAAQVGNSPVIPDGWVACSERMPKKGQEVLCTDRFENYETALYDTGYIPGPPFFATTAGEFHPSHWMPLPTPPQK